MNIYEQVRQRDGNKCRVCLYPGYGGAGIEVHHIVYRSHGGPDEAWNLICLCNPCHGQAHKSKWPKWLLHLTVMTGHSLDMIEKSLQYSPSSSRVCLSCQHRTYDGCEIWEHPVDWDYSCPAWKLRTDQF